MTEEARFATTGTITDSFYKDNAQYMISPQFRRKRLILATLVVGMCLAGYVLVQNVMYLYILGIYAVTYVPFTLWYRRSAVKTLIKRSHEVFSDGKYTITVSCTDQGVRSENHATGGATVVEYASLDTLAMGEGAFILMSKAGQFTVFFTESMSEQEMGELLAFLQEKCPKLKIIR